MSNRYRPEQTGFREVDKVNQQIFRILNELAEKQSTGEKYDKKEGDISLEETGSNQALLKMTGKQGDYAITLNKNIPTIGADSVSHYAYSLTSSTTTGSDVTIVTVPANWVVKRIDVGVDTAFTFSSGTGTIQIDLGSDTILEREVGRLTNKGVISKIWMGESSSEQNLTFNIDGTITGGQGTILVEMFKRNIAEGGDTVLKGVAK